MLSICEKLCLCIFFAPTALKYYSSQAASMIGTTGHATSYQLPATGREVGVELTLRQVVHEDSAEEV